MTSTLDFTWVRPFRPTTGRSPRPRSSIGCITETGGRIMVRSDTHNRVCENVGCNRSFPVAPRAVNPQRFCSRNCANQAAARQRRGMPHQTSTRNTSGIIGAHLGSKLSGRTRTLNFVWVTTWCVDGRQRRREWSIIRHGYEGAFRLAAAFRIEQVGGVFPGRVPKIPARVKEWMRARGAL